MRLLGFVVGSVLSISALVLLVGMPIFRSAPVEDRAALRTAAPAGVDHRVASDREPAVADDDGGDDEPDGFANRVPAADATAAGIAPAGAPVTSLRPEDAGQPSPPGDPDALTLPGNPGPPAIPSGSEPGHEASAADASVMTADTALEAVPAPDAPVGGTEPQWQSFWNPFRSELAANGFVQRLERVTGLDYRVVRVNNGVYQVAFSYASDAERDTRLSQIAAVTGLDLSDSQP